MKIHMCNGVLSIGSIHNPSVIVHISAFQFSGLVAVPAVHLLSVLNLS